MAFVAYKDTGYKVSEKGEVMNPKGHVLVNVNIGRGYKRVIIKGRRLSVHRLVAECFIPNPNGLGFVNHKDGNPSNNHFSNLEWCDRSYNQKHAYANGLQRAKKSWDNVLSKAVDMFTRSGEYVRSFGSLKEAMRFLGKPGCAYSDISRCCNGIRKTAFSHTWKWHVQRQNINMK